MQLLDTNVWFALVLTGHAFHDATRAFFEVANNRDRHRVLPFHPTIVSAVAHH